MLFIHLNEWNNVLNILYVCDYINTINIEDITKLEKTKAES